MENKEYNLKESLNKFMVDQYTIDDQIKALQKKKAEALKVFIKEHAYFKVGEHFKIKYPNPVVPREELEVMDILVGANYLNNVDILYKCKRIERTTKGMRKKFEREVTIPHEMVSNSEITITHTWVEVLK